MLEARNLSKQFGRTPALRDVTLTIPTGAFTVLIGPSGCGKSTLLRHFIGLLRPDQGDVVFDGTPLLEASIRRVRHRTGYVIQEGGLFPHLTAERNVTLLAARLGWPVEKRRSRLAELCDLTHFPTDALARYPGQLSGGQRQRVALMRALMLEPELLLLDEPLGALDPLVRASLQRELRDTLRTLGVTTVMVTHDLAEAAWFSDDIVLMRDGSVLQRGSLSAMRANPASPFVRDFIEAQQALHLAGEDG